MNEQFKASMKAHFAHWYFTEVRESLYQRVDVLCMGGSKVLAILY